MNAERHSYSNRNKNYRYSSLKRLSLQKRLLIFFSHTPLLTNTYFFPLANTRKVVKEILNLFGIVVAENQLVFVTDNGSNIVAALTGEAHVRCASHCLNLTIQKAIEIVPSLKTIVDDCSLIVTHFRRTGLPSSLATTLKKDIDTRWNSIVEMFQSILLNKDEIIQLLNDRNEDHRIASISFQLIDDLC